MLGALVTLEELQKNILGFQKSKNLGLDGWLLEPFIDFFKLMGEDLPKVVEQAHITRRIISDLNATFIALILKSLDPRYFNEF